MTKNVTRKLRKAKSPKKFTALKDPANIAFMSLIKADKGINVETIAVDSGRIAIGDCETIQLTLETATGDGLYPVWYGEKYIVIENDMLNIMKLDQELTPWLVKSKKKHDAAEEKARQQKIQDDFEKGITEEED